MNNIKKILRMFPLEKNNFFQARRWYCIHNVFFSWQTLVMKFLTTCPFSVQKWFIQGNPKGPFRHWLSLVQMAGSVANDNHLGAIIGSTGADVVDKRA